MIVKCTGFNEKNLHPLEFQRLFNIECRKIGHVVQMMNFRGVLLATVEDGR